MALTAIPTFQAITGVDHEPQFVVSYPYEGVTHVVGFSTLNELIQIVVDYKDRRKRPLPSDLINLIVDFAEESMEWNDQQPTYPLGVVYVGEAVCDFGEPAYDPRTVAFRRPVEPSPYWEWAAATLRIGAVTAPWVIVMLAGRVVWGWL